MDAAAAMVAVRTPVATRMGILCTSLAPFPVVSPKG